ncbi:uncharacterized protein G2W53_004475 [Senna tora]|uniref:Uncharacterized protein n=1 Tax=Senna tora TaxID=362788 RepID=A0A835CK86_9FABA|nr:uncharacterized protein G2W53_004475 [Senna tora]
MGRRRRWEWRCVKSGGWGVRSGGRRLSMATGQPRSRYESQDAHYVLEHLGEGKRRGIPARED